MSPSSFAVGCLQDASTKAKSKATNHTRLPLPRRAFRATFAKLCTYESVSYMILVPFPSLANASSGDINNLGRKTPFNPAAAHR